MRRCFVCAPPLEFNVCGKQNLIPLSVGSMLDVVVDGCVACAARTRLDIFLSGAYSRPLEPSIYHLIHNPFCNMANVKGSSFDPSSGTMKKPRTVFTPKQLLHLEEEFVKNPFPNMEQRKQIAKDLDLTQQHIQIWFQNRRAKKRRKKKRHTEEEKMRCNPEPPSFWPSNLPFSSNIGDVLRNPSEESSSTEGLRAQVTSDAINGRDSPTDEPPTSDQNTPPTTTLLSTTTDSRLSELPCISQDAPVKSPVMVLTPGSRQHPLVPTPPPPPYISPVTTHPTLLNYAASPIVSVMNHASPVLTQPSDLSLQNYPPLPPPESLLTGSFDDPGPYPTSSVMSQMCDGATLHNLHTLSTHARSILPPVLPPPPYSFGSSLASCNIVLSSQISYTMDHHAPPSSNTAAEFINPLALSMNPPSKPPLSISSETPSIILSSRGAPISPTVSPITNSDCSLADASPLTQDVVLQAAVSKLSSTSSSGGGSSHLPLPNEGASLITSFGSLQRVASPVHATDLQERDWELFSNSLCPVIQTEHNDMWAAPVTAQMHPSGYGATAMRNKAAGGAVTHAPTTGTLMSPQQYSAMYGVGFFPPEAAAAVSSNQSFSVSSIAANGAKH